MIERWYFAGIGKVPTWVLVLEAAGDDPLRAAEIEQHVSELWWARWLLNREQRLKAQERASKGQS